jgi:hypothetical protein
MPKKVGYGNKRMRDTPKKNPARGNKDGKAKLGGKTIRFEEGGLHRSLGVPMKDKFTKSELERYKKVPEGKDIRVRGKNVKMTPKIKKQLTLGINLMK